MKINKEIFSILNETEVSVTESLLFLFSIHFGIEDVGVSFITKNSCKILGLVEEDENGYYLLIPLLENTSSKIDDSFIRKEYTPLFKMLGKKIDNNSIKRRLIRLVSERSDITKEEIIEATKLYISETDAKFIRQPDYFILKGSGVDKTQDILIWIEKLRKIKEMNKVRDDTRSLL